MSVGRDATRETGALLMRRRVAALMLSVACMMVGAFGAAHGAQETKGLGVVRPGGGASVVGGYGKSYALVVGVGDYTAGWPDLESVAREVAEVERMLAARGFEVVKHLDPDAAGLEQAFEDFIARYGYDRAHRLLFYISGHGYTLDEGRRGYLVPRDAPHPARDEAGFRRKALAMTQILAWAREMTARHALFLFDSCFSGTIFRTRALPESAPHIGRLTGEPVRQFITAGSAGEEVPARSVFTPAFVDAIEHGEGDLDGDGYVTGMELGVHLQAKVSRYVEQTPQFGKIQDYALSRGDFVFRAGGGAGGTGRVGTDGDAGAEQAAERDYWEMCRGNANPAYCEAYVKHYPRGRFRALADIRLADLTGGGEATVVAAGEIARAEARRKAEAKREAEKRRQAEEERRRIAELAPEMVGIAGGCFLMGSPASEKGWSDRERRHRVCVEDFSIGKYEVTFEQYDRYVEATGGWARRPNGAGWGRGRRPVIKVSWDDATAYAQWLSGETGRSYRLATEAEWEYAARAGSTTAYPWGDGIGRNRANCNGCGSRWDYKQTAPVGSFPANAWGLHDTVGNVGEWTCSSYDSSYGGAEKRCATEGKYRVLRGGSWVNEPWRVRSANRGRDSPDNRAVNIGFRLVQD